MKKIQIPMVLLGLLLLLYSAGIAAVYVLAIGYHREPRPETIMAVRGAVALVFGLSFVIIGFGLQKILYTTPKLPVIVLRVWFIATLIHAFVMHTATFFGLLFVVTIFWYLSWALNKEIGDSD